MKILFVINMVETTEPMGVMLLSALAKSGGRKHETYIHVLSNGGFEEKIKTLRPDIVAFSAKTGEYKYYREANRILKKINSSAISIVGGPHCTFNPRTVIESGGFDALGVGECDGAWPDFLDAVENGRGVNDIPNIVTAANFDAVVKFNDQGDAFYPNIRPRKEALDDLPFSDYELFYDNTDFVKFSPRRTFMTSRGCPFRCTYCFNRQFNSIYKQRGRLHNRYSVDRVCTELKYIKDRWPGTRFIKFYDDVFTLKTDDWLREFSEKYPREVGLPFLCLTRADVVTRNPEILPLLKKAGIHSISMSIESGNAHIRDHILDRDMTREHMLTAFHQAYDLGIYTFSNTILAIPVADEAVKEYNLPSAIERDIEGLDLNLETKATFGEFPILFPYPGTKLGKYCVDKGFFDGNFEGLHASYQTTSPLSCFTKREKMMQQNLALLSTVCMFFGGSHNTVLKALSPYMRDLTAKLLIKLPFTKLYFLWYALVKNYLYKYKIYKSEFSWKEFIKSSFKLLTIDLFKQFNK